MDKIDTGIPGLFELHPRVMRDDRGWFKEALSLRTLEALGIATPTFVQINHSRTKAHTFRGLHFQTPPHAQAKYVRCVLGQLSDIVVDIRRGSPTYGACYEITLTEENHRVLYIPQGFAHGFYAVTECELEYAVFGAGYVKEAEGGLRVDDPAIGFPWERHLKANARQPGQPSMNARDASWPDFATFESPFVFEGQKERA